MDQTIFFNNLNKMYLNAPVNKPFEPLLDISQGHAQLNIQVKKEHFHSANYLHGSVIFKLLDDSSFFAAQSIETTYFVVTASYTSHFIRPVNKGSLKAIGKIISKTKSRIIAESNVYDDNDKLIANGSGVFVASSSTLDLLF